MKKIFGKKPFVLAALIVASVVSTQAFAKMHVDNPGQTPMVKIGNSGGIPTFMFLQGFFL